MKAQDTFSTTDAATIIGVPFETLRFWDKTHCLPMVTFKESGKWRRLDSADLIKLALMARLVDAHIPPFEASFVVHGLTGGIPLETTRIRFLAIGRFERGGRDFFRFRLIADTMTGEWMVNPRVWGEQGTVSYIEFDSSDPSHRLMLTTRRGDKPAIATFPPDAEQSASTLSPYSVLLLDIVSTRDRVFAGIEEFNCAKRRDSEVLS